MNPLRIFVFFTILQSCISNNFFENKTLADPINTHYGSALGKYQFQDFKLLSKANRKKLQLNNDQNIDYVLFEQYYRNIFAISHGKERIYIVGEHRPDIKQTLENNQNGKKKPKEYYDLWLVVEHAVEKNGRKEKQYLHFSLNQKQTLTVKKFVLSVQDFSGDGLADFFFGFEQEKSLPYYYVYSFIDMALKTIVRPWNSFSEQEQQNGIQKYYSPFMREISADIYPAFVAEIGLDFNYKITIDLAPLSDVLIRNKIYDHEGLILQKRGIPHLDFQPILFPVRHKSGQYMLRSVQQVRNRYGQIGIFVCNWIFRRGDSHLNNKASTEILGRWIPDETSIEFLMKPRI